MQKVLLSVIIGIGIIASLFGFWYYSNVSIIDSNPSMTLKEVCENNGGTWTEEYHECLNLNGVTCSVLGGTYRDCGGSYIAKNGTEYYFATAACRKQCLFDWNE